eukprot:28359_5
MGRLSRSHICVGTASTLPSEPACWIAALIDKTACWTASMRLPAIITRAPARARAF